MMILICQLTIKYPFLLDLRVRKITQEKHEYLLNTDMIRARVGGKVAAWDLAYFTKRVCMNFNRCIKRNDFPCL